MLENVAVALLDGHIDSLELGRDFGIAAGRERRHVGVPVHRVGAELGGDGRHDPLGHATANEQPTTPRGELAVKCLQLCH